MKTNLKTDADNWGLIRERPLHRCCSGGGCGGLLGSPVLAHGLCEIHMHQGIITVHKGMI